jgi:hypothetical protein
MQVHMTTTDAGVMMWYLVANPKKTNIEYY